MVKRILSDWSLLFLIFFNGYLIWYYYQDPGSFKTLVWLYWMQSVMLGFFSAIEIFLAKNPDPTSMRVNGKPLSSSRGSSGCLGLFFLVHYGGFHLVYAVFLAVQLKGNFQSNVFLLGVALIFIDLTLSFISRRIAEKRTGFVNTGGMFFLPYLRILPMHLMIMGPAFLGWSNISIFLWLKAIVDVLMHLLLRRSSPQKTTSVII